MRYALTFMFNDGGGEEAWDSIDTVIVDGEDLTADDFYNDSTALVERVLTDYGLTAEQINNVIPDRYFIKNIDDIDIKIKERLHE